MYPIILLKEGKMLLIKTDFKVTTKERLKYGINEHKSFEYWINIDNYIKFSKERKRKKFFWFSKGLEKNRG